MAWSAGFIDAGCYLRVQGTYVSHITGSTASTAFHLAGGGLADAARFACAVGSFALGLLIGASLRHIERRQRIRSAFAAVLGLELLLLALFIACARRPLFPVPGLIFFAAAAMGMQTVTRVGKIRVYTTFHTGSLSKFAEATAAYLFWVWDRTRGHSRGRILQVLRATPRQASAQQSAVALGVWLGFFTGGLAGTISVSKWGSVALVSAMVPLLWAIVVDWRRPAALQDRICETDLE